MATLHTMTDIPGATNYELAQVYLKYGDLPAADHANLLALLAVADAVRQLTTTLAPARAEQATA